MSDQSARKPMLFSPPLPPVSLAARHTVVIGRSRECDLVLAAGDASRKHCEVLARGDRFAVRDLGSRNGTFVNGERVEAERALNAGDQIELGSSTITFCQVDAGLHGAAPNNAETQFFAKPTSAEAFRGDLEEIPPFAVLQILEMGCKTGLLELSGDQDAGRLWLANGRPVHAEAGKQIGFDAAIAMANTARGRFRFEPQIDAPRATIQASVTQLLLEAARLLDEARALDPGDAD